MKLKQFFKNSSPLFAISVFAFMVIAIHTDQPLQAGIWDYMKEKALLQALPGSGDFIAYQRNVDPKVTNFPVEVINDGYKMVRVYQTLMDNYSVEWVWRVTLKNKTMQEVAFSFEYKLQDKDSFSVVSSKELLRKIAPGETVTIEKTDSLPYETAKRVTASTFYIQLQR
jgi:hypothetical protein